MDAGTAASRPTAVARALPRPRKKAAPVDSWVGPMRTLGWPAVLFLVAAGTLYLVWSGRPSLALLGPPAGIVAAWVMHQAPWRLPRIHAVQGRNRARVQSETRRLLAYALVYPMFEIPVVLWCVKHPGPSLVGSWSSSPMLSLSYVALPSCCCSGFPLSSSLD